MQRRRFKNWAKWACTLAVVAAGGLALLSKFYAISSTRVSKAPRETWVVEVCGGMVSYMRFSSTSPDPNGGSLFEVRRVRLVPWSWGARAEFAARGNIPGGGAGVLWSRTPSSVWFAVSVIHPVLILALPAALLWYADRRRHRPGRCGRCGYDRRGLTDTACPECGTVPAPASK